MSQIDENDGHKIVKVVNDTLHIHESVIHKTPRLEQIRKHPELILLSLGLFIITVILGQIEHPLSTIFQIITGTYAVALTPINKQRKII